ncbi:MAG: pyrroline-5-carboxylate reductase family protein [Bacteroidales bacterium]
METIVRSVGFLGGGRITRIVLQAFANKNLAFDCIKGFDKDPEKLEKLKSFFPSFQPAENAAEVASSCRMVVLALHPQDIPAVLNEIAPVTSPDTILISLAPKITIAQIQSAVAKTCPVVRMIPNAPSIINQGYNAVAFSKDILQNKQLHDLLCQFFSLGECSQTDEKNLEAYAVITGMGPTYLWFQLHELVKIAIELGLDEKEARDAIAHMVKGSVDTLLTTNLTYEDVLDLIPFHPFGQHHETIRKIYQETLTKIYEKIKP